MTTRVLASRSRARARQWALPRLPGDGYRGRRRVLAILAWLIVVLVVAEVSLQVRSQILTGQSALSLLLDGPQTIRDAVTGLRLLRPGAVIRGTREEIRSNSLGLRSPEIPPLKSTGEYRIVVIGGSSVMGAYSPTNEQTFSAYLESRLRSDLGSPLVNVINAGIYGATLNDQTLMLKYVTARLKPDLVLLYTGFNDFASYCSAQPSSARVRNEFALPVVELPPWVQTVEMLRKNTTLMRPTVRGDQHIRDPRTVDPGLYRAKLDRLLAVGNETGAQMILATNTRAYRPDQPPKVQEQLARTARFFNSCFDVPGLHDLYKQHTRVMQTVAADRAVPLLRLDEMVPGGPQYFQDSTHFNDRGNLLVADLLSKALAERGYPGRVGGPR